MPPSELPPPTDLPVIRDPAAIDAAARALVYCYVEWGIDERFSRHVVRTAVAELRETPDPVPFDFFAIEEDAPAAAAWLVAHGWSKHPGGWGAVLWLERGRCVATEMCAKRVGAAAIVTRTRSLWSGAAA